MLSIGNGGPSASVTTLPTMAASPAVQPAAKPSAEVQAKVLGIFKELTNYPEEILELDAELESDLGLDSVKQIEIMGALMKEFGIPAQENFEINKYNTIRKSIDFVSQNLTSTIKKAS
jgi:acyl carrier protein